MYAPRIRFGRKVASRTKKEKGKYAAIRLYRGIKPKPSACPQSGGRRNTETLVCTRQHTTKRGECTT